MAGPFHWEGGAGIEPSPNDGRGERMCNEDDVQEEMYHEKALKEETEECAKVAKDMSLPADWSGSDNYFAGYTEACEDITEAILKRIK